jgi:hypothetical protein
MLNFKMRISGALIIKNTLYDINDLSRAMD